MHTLLTRLISPVKKVIKGVCFYLVVVGAVLARPQLALAQTALSDPSMKGKVIDLGDGNPWLVVQSTAQTGTKSGYVYIMAMYNYGNYAWGLSNTNPSTAISTTSDVGTIYTNLPATIDGVAKAVALGSHTWQWDSCTQTGSCTNTVTSVSPISFVSYREWQGTTLDAWGDIESEPSFGSVGQLFCTAWKGIVCVGSGISSNFNYPWLRSGTTLDSGSAWSIGGSPLTGGMMSGRDVTLSYGSLPIAWLSSSFCTSGGLGTYASPHTLEVCNTPPTLPTPDPTVTNSADPSIGAFASYVSEYSSLTLAGTVNDLDVGQTLTIQYQIDSTAGSWSNLTTLTANGSNQPWSGTVNLPAGLSAGSHTIYIRVYDGYTYSPNKSVNFVLDLTAPTNTVSLVGGILCTGITTIYCTPPTGINLAASSDNAAGIGAYRTQWDTTFAAGDVSPSWVTGTPPSNLATTGHTTSGQTHTLYYQTRDKVGNVSSVESISYYVNSTPVITLNDSSHDRVITPYTPLVLSGTFTDLDPTQTVTVKATINGIDYVSQTYPATSSVVAWEIVIPASSLLGLSPPQLTNFPLTITDSAGVSSIAYYTGQISVSSSTSSEIYLSVIKNIPFSLTIGKVGAFNITFGTNQGITVSTNSSDEIIVSGSLSSPVSIPFGITTLVFTILDEPSTQVQQIEFV